MSTFRKINFGYSSAETESVEAPDLLLKGYVDLHHATEQALNGPKYLFLGYKGSGKSAIGERLRLLHLDKYNQFVSYVSLADFPFSNFAKIIRGDLEPEAKFPTAWGWVLGIYILNSLRRDEACTTIGFQPLHETISFLEKIGLLPNPNIAQMIRQTSRKTFRIGVPEWFQFGYEEGAPESAANIPHFVHHFRELIYKVRSTSKHFVIVDGLDEILTKRDTQYQSIGSLVYETNRLNTEFRKHGCPVKIILLCRTDLFERVSGANKNKIRQDSSIELDWYSDPRDPNSSMLVQIAERRAALVSSESKGMFDRYFPSSIEDRRILTFLLDLTRHTPRDFLQLLKQIQEFSKDGRLTREQILSGVRKYSIDYFLPEIIDEMEGYADNADIHSVLEIMGRLRRRDFLFSDLAKVAVEHKYNISDEKILNILTSFFECSALGNITKRPSDAAYFTFRYRNTHSTFNSNEKIMLHRGLWKALNLI